MISNHLNLVEQHRPDAESIAERIAQCLAAGGRIDKLKSPPCNPLPSPRSKKIDPETVLKRRPKPISAADRKTLRKMADAI
ncbi:hypothetical protein [Pseudomonas fluorescens]|uniref:hypothetical protein n=1 Tax=Pseudomonas fluorescens TaxID=294 RepID=UPI00285AB8D2|nr:hypothetical protein [Pseudomonas fluorescens]MDR6162366.1 hypothetical protein [Pseudomonas fluorescens]